MSKRANSTFYCTLNTRNKYQSHFRESRGGFPSEETPLSSAKCVLTTQGIKISGYVILTKFRISLLSMDKAGDFIPCAPNSVSFYDPRLDILLPQIHRIYLVKQDPNAAAIAEHDQTEMEKTVTPSIEMQKKLNLVWLPFPSSYNSQSMDFLYMQIQCTDFNSLCIVFDKKEPSSDFLSNLSNLLRYDSPNQFHYLYNSSVLYDCPYFAPLKSCDWNLFEDIEDYNRYLGYSIDLSIRIPHLLPINSFVGYCIYRTILTKFKSLRIPERELQNFPRFSFHFARKNFAKFIFRYNVGNIGHEGLRSKLALDPSLPSNFEHSIDICSILGDMFELGSLSYIYDLISEFVQFRTGRTKKFAKLAIKHCRSIFDQSGHGWFFYLSQCLTCAADVANSIFTSTKPLITIINSSNNRNSYDLLILVSSLSQIMLSPSCRTTKGFIELIQKDWIGDDFYFPGQLPRFLDNKPKLLKRYLEKVEGTINGKRVKELFRASVITNRGTDEGSPRIQNQQPPIFLLFLDCVYQLTRLFPTDFEFTSVFLCQVWNLLLTGAFSNFMEPKSSSNVSNLWLWIQNYYDELDSKAFKNPLFGMCVDSDRKHSQLSFNPVTYDVRNLEIWDDLFFQHHTDCNSVQMVDMEYEMRKKSGKKKSIPVPNGIERLKVIDTSADSIRNLATFIVNVGNPDPDQDSDSDGGTFLGPDSGEASGYSQFERGSSRSMSFGYVSGVKRTLVRVNSYDDRLSFLGDDDSDTDDVLASPSPMSERKSSRGYGFVELPTPSSSTQSITSMQSSSSKQNRESKFSPKESSKLKTKSNSPNASNMKSAFYSELRSKVEQEQSQASSSNFNFGVSGNKKAPSSPNSKQGQTIEARLTGPYSPNTSSYPSSSYYSAHYTSTKIHGPVVEYDKQSEDFADGSYESRDSLEKRSTNGSIASSNSGGFVKVKLDVVTKM